MLDTGANLPQGLTLPKFAGDFKRYADELQLSLTTQITQLWARAETLDKDSSIEDGVIEEAYIANLAVTTAKIANLAVGTAQIADLAVGTAKIALLAVDTAQMANLAVTNAKIGLLAVDTAQIALLAVGSAQIALLAVGEAQIANLAVTAAKIALATITNAQIANATINTANIGLLQVTSAVIDNLTVGTTKITGAAVTRGAEYWAAGSVNICNTGEHELASITVTTNVDADYVWLWSSFVILQNPWVDDGKDGYATAMTFTLRRTNSTGTIIDQWTNPTWGTNIGLRSIMMGTDAPGAAGSITYKLYARIKTSNTWSACGIVSYRMLLGLAKSK